MITNKQLKLLRNKITPYVNHLSKSQMDKMTLEGERKGTNLWLHTL